MAVFEPPLANNPEVAFPPVANLPQPVDEAVKTAN